MINEFLRYAYNSQGCKVSEMTQRKRPSLIKTGFLAVTSKPLLLIPGPFYMSPVRTLNNCHRALHWDGPANNCQFRMILISKYNYRLKPKMNTLVFDIYGIILYSVILT